jgi:DNA-directed RNA polymerase specialized sigma24 family protein
MQGDGSITRWVRDLQAGDGSAAAHLWERFFKRMKGLARSRANPGAARGLYDEEDVALSAFAGFCRALQAGAYADLQGRDELWRLLTQITLNKGRERARRESALKRGGAARPVSLDDTNVPALDDIPAPVPSPDLLLAMTEECQRLLAVLGDRELEAVALMKLEGHTNEEIAEHFGCTRRTVQRMLALIRQAWGSLEG